ncbi:helix-turn-helix domain-containing protein [Microbispora rosea]|uniref:helix-turn-helix domain-containing protein n=1 Tax=Microbispora rosea TaxID=58117 RepID=UPI0013565531|nr:helix-turn-helix domain-containing protein [Microbispora rosea]GIH47331.1 membrane protein [Microbispora rosea subsp. rosea]
MAEARERAGLTVRQLGERTRIRETVIERFERDDFSVGDFYARGHIRTIASDLGLDPDEILRQYEQENADIASPVKASAVFRGDVGERARRAPSWTTAVAVALAIVAVVVIARMIGSSGEKAGPTAAQLPVTAPHAHARHEKGHEKKTVEEALAPGVVVVKVTARKPSYLNVRDAKGKEIFQGTVPEGKTTTYSAKDRMRVTIGDAGAVRLEVNGRDLGTPGKDGQMIRRTFEAGGPSPR